MHACASWCCWLPGRRPSNVLRKDWLRLSPINRRRACRWKQILLCLTGSWKCKASHSSYISYTHGSSSCITWGVLLAASVILWSPRSLKSLGSHELAAVEGTQPFSMRNPPSHDLCGWWMAQLWKELDLLQIPSLPAQSGTCPEHANSAGSFLKFGISAWSKKKHIGTSYELQISLKELGLVEFSYVWGSVKKG